VTGAQAARPPVNAILGAGCLIFAVGVTCFLPHPNPLQMFAVLALISAGATIAVGDHVAFARWQSRLLSLSGPAVIFLFVALLGAAFLDPDHFASLGGWLVGARGTK
jgi:hypothetical protein